MWLQFRVQCEAGAGEGVVRGEGHRGGDFGQKEEVHIGESSGRGGWTDWLGPDQKVL